MGWRRPEDPPAAVILDNALRSLLAPARPASLRGRAILLAIAVALVAGLSWASFVASFPISQRLRGDAHEYFSLALSFPSLDAAIHYVGHRSVGFPLALYLLRRLLEALDIPVSLSDPSTLLRAFTAGMFVLHCAATLLFARAARDLGRSLKLDLPWAPFLLLLAHPGLVAHTTIFLTETLCADLFMLSLALLAIGARASSLALRVAAPAAAGVLFGAVALIRTSYAIPTGFTLTAAALLASAAVLKGRRPARRILWMVLASAVGFGCCVAPAASRCQAVFGESCLQDPSVSRGALYYTLSVGRSSPRQYWSRYSISPDWLVILRDPELTHTWERDCDIDVDAADFGLSTCFLEHPAEGANFLVKKSIALLDHSYIHPYAVDVTPRWVRLGSRPFGALAFMGLASAFGFLVVALRRRAAVIASSAAAALCLFVGLSAALCGVHALFHIEPRYGLGAVPGLYLALALALAALRRARPALRGVAYVALFWLGVVFLAQTARWDRLDPCLGKIEQAIR